VKDYDWSDIHHYYCLSLYIAIFMIICKYVLVRNMRKISVIFTVLVLVSQAFLIGLPALALRYTNDTNLANTNDGKYDGEVAGDWAGWFTSIAGDLNGDGYEDLLVSAPFWDQGATTKGKVYVMFGKGSGWSMIGDLGMADASYIGLPLNDYGKTLAGVGDVNGDGFDDILIGAKGNDEVGTNAGKVYLLYGKQTGWATSGASIETTNNGSFRGNKTDDMAGVWLAGAGDVNGDGYHDFLIAAARNDDAGSNAGTTYLFFGMPGGFSDNTSVRDADFKIYGEAVDDNSGMRLDGVGDVNGDGYDDIVIGAAHNDDGGSNAGKSYLILGKADDWGKSMNLRNADASFIGEGPGEFSATSIAGAGDLNGDSLDDFIIGATKNDGNGTAQGKVYVIFGKVSPWKKDVNLTKADASYIGEADNGELGSNIKGAGDIDGDGYDDLALGAVKFGSYRGQTYIILGKRTGWPQMYNMSTVDASFRGNAADHWAGLCFGAGGDVNRDGTDDLIIGAHKEGNGQKGKVYIIFPEKFSGPISSTSLTVYDDSGYSNPVLTGKVFQKFYVEYRSLGGMGSKKETTQGQGFHRRRLGRHDHGNES